MVFGKPGRPPEDRLLRQREIYEAVIPLPRESGARKLTMREAAHAACLSLGGLYHYFPTKRELVLHGLDEAARNRLCQESKARLDALRAKPFDLYLDEYLSHAEMMFQFIHPSVQAALELGHHTFQESLDAGLTVPAAKLIDVLRLIAPELAEDKLETLGRNVMRAMLGSLVDRNAAPDDVHQQLRPMIEGYISGVRDSRQALAG